MSLFVDTSVWYAAADRGDRSHRRATEILSAGERLVCSDHILMECWLLLRHRLDRIAADRLWRGLLGGIAVIEIVCAAELHAAMAIAELFGDQDFSLLDCTSFALMRRLGINRAASFDDDFAIFRYGPRRDQAFEIIR